MFGKDIGTMEILFTLPKPVSHLESRLILRSQGVLGGGGMSLH